MSAPLPGLAEFEADALRAGFDDVVVREWLPGYTMADHAHDHAVKAMVVRGDLWVESSGQMQRCGVGESFALGAAASHKEGAGAQGAQFWVARRYAAGASPSSYAAGASPSR